MRRHQGKQRHTVTRTVTPVRGGLRVVALFEGAKGILVLLTGFGLLSLIHGDVHLAAAQLIRHLHLNPASHYPVIFLDAATRVTDFQLWSLAAAALLYAGVRVMEAFGLWMQRPWAEWFGLLTGGMYIPLELYEVIRCATWPRTTILVVNSAIVLYLLTLLLGSRKSW